MLEKTHLFREIHEQPAVLERFLGAESRVIKDLAQTINKKNITHIVIAARGTSDNAARYAQYVFGSHNELVVALATPSLFSIYKRPPKFGNALVLGISQSGKSPDIVQVVEEARRQGALTAVITNSPDSNLARQGDFVIDLHAGEEKAVAATKTYTAELGAIASLSAYLAEDQNRQSEISKIPGAMAQTLSMREIIALAAPRYRYMERSVVIGRGYNYATAFEMALKMTELTYTIVQSYSSADFLHGPLAMIEPSFPVIVIAPSGAMINEMDDLVATLQIRHAEVIAISDDEDLLSKVRIPLALPHSVPEWLSPLVNIIPGQMFCMYLAFIRDYDVDSPRNIMKVTETN